MINRHWRLEVETLRLLRKQRFLRVEVRRLPRKARRKFFVLSQGAEELGIGNPENFPNQVIFTNRSFASLEGPSAQRGQPPLPRTSSPFG
jgi:hypothetical protein